MNARISIISAIRRATVFVALPLLAGSVALGDANELVENSPFLPEGFTLPRDRRDRTPPPPPRSPNQPQPLDQLEFRGMTQVGGKRSFSLFDATEQQSFWIGPSQTEAGFTVLEFKEKEDAVVVRHEGKTRTIALHESKVQEMAGTSDTTQRRQVRNNQAQPAAQPEDPESRMQNLAEEIRRRREVRRALIERSENGQGNQQTNQNGAGVPELPSP